MTGETKTTGRARLAASLAAATALACAPALGAESGHSGPQSGPASMGPDHSMHQGAGHAAMGHDHTAAPGGTMGPEHKMSHGMTGPMPPSADNPHAHHMGMMQQTAFERSEQTYELPDRRLIDMNGRETSLLKELDGGKPVIVNFIFTTCTTICPVLSATFGQVQASLGDRANDVRMVSISIDPEEDTPERLRAYAKRYKAGTEWRFFTGRLDDIIAIQKAFHVYYGNKMSHQPAILLREAAAGPWVRLEGFASASEVVKEYESLQRADG